MGPVEQEERLGRITGGMRRERPAQAGPHHAQQANPLDLVYAEDHSADVQEGPKATHQHNRQATRRLDDTLRFGPQKDQQRKAAGQGKTDEGVGCPSELWQVRGHPQRQQESCRPGYDPSRCLLVILHATRIIREMRLSPQEHPPAVLVMTTHSAYRLHSQIMGDSHA